MWVNSVYLRLDVFEYNRPAMKSILYYLIFLIFCGFLITGGVITSCTHEPNFITEFDIVCFEDQILPIMQTSCGISGCHNSSSGGESDFDATNYNSIRSMVVPGNAKESKLYQVITKIYGEDMMPPDRPLSKEQRNLILVWIEQGANNTTCDTYLPDTSSNPGTINPDSICFVQDVQPLIYSSCATSGCHDAVTAKEGYNFTDYDHIMAKGAVVPFSPNESKLYKVLNESGEDRMPPYPLEPLSDEKKEIIRKWIADGALNSDCPSNSCDTSGTISFAEQVWPAINTSCVGCHNASLANGGVDLSSYNQVYTYATTLRNNTPVLLGVIKQLSGFKAMPPSGKFDDCTIRQIELWIEQGASYN